MVPDDAGRVPGGVTTFRAVLLPLAVLLIGLGLLIGGRPAPNYATLGTVLIVLGTAAAGAAAVLVLAGS